MASILFETQNHIATITLNQPSIHNAFDNLMLEELLNHFDTIANNPEIRVLVLQANGKSFSAGANLKWMQRMKAYDYTENVIDAKLLADMMQSLYEMSKPTVAVVQGAAFGGGVGLVACCDIAIASDNAIFCLSETRLGLIPAVISPYVINAIGERQARRYFLTAEKIDATMALRLGLIHEALSAPALAEMKKILLQNLSQNGPRAIAAAKKLIVRTSRKSIDDDMINYTIEQIANIRVSEEGQEGLCAFLEKRQPAWQK